MFNEQMKPLIACHDCDLLQYKVPLKPDQSAQCIRCAAVLSRQKKDALNRTLAFSISGLVLFILANVFPFMTFQFEGRAQINNLITGVFDLFDKGMLGLSFLVFLTSIMAPLIKLLGMIYILLPLKFNKTPWKLKTVFRAIQTLSPWAMMEVYLLGVFVAYVKLSDLAEVLPGIALFSFASLILMTAAADYSWDPEIVSERLSSN
jgi:paraquat-inducible protein A